ncbi:MAG: hypothetical protein RIS35_1988 [Pseudomonadota bacterium]|jgi:hypothetical protein
MAKIVILVPFAARTGGPEACYQLSDALLRQGFDAEVWPLAPEDQHALRRAMLSGARFVRDGLTLPVRENPIEDYRRYLSRPFPGRARDASTVFVLPEIFAWAVPLFAGTNVILWWLSVDNAFEALARVNLNHLRQPRVRHACQSFYALRTVETLGFTPSMLSDYTVVPELEVPAPEGRPMKVCLNAGPKVIFNLGQLRSMLEKEDPAIEVVPLRDMPRQAIYRHFSSASLYVDLGQFPGKDRMVREALLLGANVLIARAGAGANPVDYALPEECRWALGSAGELVARLVRLLRDPGAVAERLAPERARLRDEKAVFEREIRAVFGPFADGGHGLPPADR